MIKTANNQKSRARKDSSIHSFSTSKGKKNSRSMDQNSSSNNICIQPKLKLNTPNDQYEREADTMANVVEQIVLNKGTDHSTQGVLASSVSKLSNNNADKEDQVISRSSQHTQFSVSSSFANTLSSSGGNGSAIQTKTKRFMENTFSTDFSKVKIHTDATAIELNNGIQSKAFTHRNDIYFNSGQYNPNSLEGKKLLAHELTHVVQQQKHSEVPDIQRQSATNAAASAILSDSLGRTQELIDRLNLLSPAIIYFINQAGLHYEIISEDHLSDFDLQFRQLIDRDDITLFKLIERFRLVDNALGLDIADNFEDNPISLDRLLSENDAIFKTILLNAFIGGEQIDLNTDQEGNAAVNLDLSENAIASTETRSAGENLNTAPNQTIAEESASNILDEESSSDEVSVTSGQEEENAVGGGTPLLSPEPLMPTPPSELSPAASERLGQAQSNAGRRSRATNTLPGANEITSDAQAGVTEPEEETQAIASADLTAALNDRAEPSPQIEELCDRIREVIRNKRPPDEDSLLEADPEEAANEAGSQLNDQISSDMDRVEGGYDEINNGTPGTPQQIGETPELPPVEVNTPSINAAEAVPDHLPSEEVSLDEDVANTSAAMNEAGMTNEVTAVIEDPNNPVVSARDTQGELEQTAAEDPAVVLARQDEAISNARGNMEELQSQALQALEASRAGTLTGTGSQQTALIGTEEQKRAQLGRQAEAIFTSAQDRVNTLMEPLSRTAMEMWTTGKESIASEFKAKLAEVQSWVDERHSGVGGFLVSVGDYFTGLPDWVTEEYDSAEFNFSEAVCDKIREISTYVNRIVLTCEQIISNADEQIGTLFESARGELGDWVDQERQGFSTRLEDLENEVHETRDDFNRDLSTQAAQAVQEVREEVHTLREAAKGLIGRIADAIAAFIEDPVKFIIEGLLKLVGIPPSSFWALINRIGEVIEDIANDPLGFGENLLAAVGRGFEQFFDNFGTHLLTGFVEWLFSGLGRLGIQIPGDFSLQSVISFFLQLMGFTWQRIREILVRHIGAENVELIEQAFTLLSDLISMGPTGIFEMIKEQLDPQRILDMIMDAAIEFVVQKITEQVAVRLLLLFNPVGAIAQAIEAIYKVLKWVFQNASRIFTLVESVVNGMADIIAGNIGGMANTVENALARLLVPVIDFVAGFLNMGDLPERVAEVVEGMQEWVGEMMDRAIGWLADKAKGLMERLGLREEEEEGELEELEDDEVGETIRFSADGEGHRLWIDDRSGLSVVVASEEEELGDKITGWVDELDTRSPEDQTTARPLLRSVTDQLDVTLTEAQQAKLAIEEAESEPSDATIEEANEQDDEVKSAEELLATDLVRLFEIFGGFLGDLPEIGPHQITNNSSYPRQSHHIPENALMSAIRGFYSTIGEALEYDDVMNGGIEVIENLGSILSERADEIGSEFNNGNNLSAILIHHDTHQDSGIGVHDRNLMNSASQRIFQEGAQNESERVILYRADGTTMLSSVRSSNWAAFIAAIYQLEGESEGRYGVDLVNIQEASVDTVVRVEGGLPDGNRLLAEQIIDDIFYRLSREESNMEIVIRDFISTIKDQVNRTMSRVFNNALDNSISVVSEALSLSFKDGSNEEHARILNDLRFLARGIWVSKIVSPI